MLEQQLHDIVVRLISGNVEWGEKLLVLIIQVATLPESERLGLRGVSDVEVLPHRIEYLGTILE